MVAGTSAERPSLRKVRAPQGRVPGNARRGENPFEESATEIYRRCQAVRVER
ncbi:hypothetical protein UNSWDHB_1716 [Dehalobacter sp. UNSWDHB]|nr:hypothetical protein DHBDCA_p2526 [Dehalobacter sp. DCA]AFV06538.1 hypothetical protein DCF50_p2535 [Dehalobacter sp. CF]EQB20997.1 hypothetical protein UNSWDHB_1716 [Dehalobacter sp. UNSWDHB]